MTDFQSSPQDPAARLFRKGDTNSKDSTDLDLTQGRLHNWDSGLVLVELYHQKQKMQITRFFLLFRHVPWI